MTEHEPLLEPESEDQQFRTEEESTGESSEEELKEDLFEFGQQMAGELVGDSEDSDAKLLFLSWCRQYDSSLELDGEKSLGSLLVDVAFRAKEPSAILGLVETCQQIIALPAESEEDQDTRSSALLALQHVLTSIVLYENLIEDTPFSNVVKVYSKDNLHNLLEVIYDEADLSNKRSLAKVFSGASKYLLPISVSLWRGRKASLAKQALQELNLESDVSQLFVLGLIEDIAFSGVKLSRQEQSKYESLPSFLAGISFDTIFNTFIYSSGKLSLPKSLFDVVWDSFRSTDAYNMIEKSGAAAGQQAPAAAKAWNQLGWAIYRAKEARVRVPKDIIKQYHRLNAMAEPYRRSLTISERSSEVSETSISRAEDI